MSISSTSKHSILHEHLFVKKICSRWIPHNLTIAQKKVRVDWCKEMLKKYDRGASEDVYKIVTGDVSMRLSRKQNNNRPCGSSKTSQIQRKLRYTTICLPKVFEVKIRTREDHHVHNDNASSHTSAQTNAFLTGQNVELMGRSPASFYFSISRKKCVVNVFRRQKMWLKRLKIMFWRCPNRSGKVLRQVV